MNKGVKDGPEPTHAERESRVRDAAYFRYLSNGCLEGRSMEDWLAAEAEIDQARLPAARSPKARRPAPAPADGH